MMLSLMSGVMPSTKIYSMSKVNLPPLKNIIFTLAIFIDQWSLGVFRLGLTNRFPFSSFMVDAKSRLERFTSASVCMEHKYN
jgi:hypothetical protein